MSKIIGIDLGTMNSCVCVVERGEPVVVPNSEGSRTTPSMVAYTQKGEKLIGHVAKRQALTNAENSFYAVKRLIGRKFDSEEVTKFREISPFPIVPSKNGDAWIKCGDKEVSPQEISAQILIAMKETAEEYLGESIEKAIVTVPAYFDDSQRQATKDAGKIAGLDIERIINEPTAAALAYGLNKNKSGKVAVFDLGGGTFDISILEITDDVFQVKSTSGDTFLGGEDFDAKIVTWLIENFQAQHGMDLRQEKMALQRLKEAAERAKHELSTSEETDIQLPFIAADAKGPKHLQISLTREKLEELSTDLIARLSGPCEQALKDAGLSKTDISELVLVGGMTRMPKIKAKAQEIFGRQAETGVNPDEVVAVGAAIQGGIIKGDVNSVLLLDVTPLSLGIENQGGIFYKLIERNTTIPTQKSEIFSTTVDNQEMVRVHVLQGERELADENKSLAVFELVGIPPAPRGIPQIEVNFEIDTDGILSVSAKDLGTQLEQKVKVNPSSGLSEEQIAKIISEAQSLASEDEQAKKTIEIKNELQGLLYAAKKSYAALATRLEEADQHAYKEAIDQAEVALDASDFGQVTEAFNRLTEHSHKIAELIYG